MKRFEKDRDLLQRYDEIIKVQLSKGVIEKVQEKNGSMKHCIPHHAITTLEKSTTKVRTVYDASAKTKKNMKSLNECLYRDNFGRCLWFATEIEDKENWNYCRH